MLSYSINRYTFPTYWKEYELKDLLIYSKNEINMLDDESYELVTVKRNFGGIYSRGELLGRDILVKSQYIISQGDFVISKRQIVHGACGIVPSNLDGAIVSNEYNVFRNNKLLDLEFFNYYVRLPFMKRYFYIMSDGVHIEKMLFKPDEWLKQKVYMPPLEEQQKIAKILSTWDKAIDLKVKLIEEKKKQKKGLMQKLLTGEVRLPGFEGEWKKVKLGDVCKTFSGGTPSRTNQGFYKNASIPWIKSGELNQRNVRITEEFITREALDNSSAKLVSPNTVLLALYGATAGVLAITEIKAAINQAVLAIIPNEDYYYLFIYYLLNNEMNNMVEKYTQGGQPNLNAKIVKNFMICNPPLNEQKEISLALSKVDRIIDLLEQELEALKLQNKGLMQLLLTGIVRVTPDKN